MSETVMSLSSSVVQLDNLGIRSNGWDRLTQNAGSTGLIVSQIESFGTSWKDYLVRHNKNYFYNKNHRWLVMNSDPIAVVHAERYPEFLLDKPPKSYDIDEEGHPVEIMTDIWERWELLNMSEPLKSIWWYMVGDGYCLTQMYKTAMNTIGYMCFGYYQSDPAIWDRYNRPWNPDEHNKIYRYLVSYIPSPNSSSYCPNYNMHAVEMYLYPEAPGFFHFTRSRYNGGIGKSKILPMWPSLTKLRKIAWYDFKSSCRFPLLEFPESYLTSDKDLSGLIDACRRWDETEGLAIPKMENQKTGEVMDYPRYFHASPDATGAMPKSDPTAGGSLLRNAEWVRILAVDGHTEASYVGSQPGQLESSKITLTLDDRADIKEFNTVVPVMKKLLQWLLMMGGLEGCDPESLERVMTGEFDIKCHVEWEVLESKMEMMEMAEEEANMQSDGTKEEAERHNAATIRYNTSIEFMIIDCIRRNEAMPMTPVMSSWIKAVGYEDNKLYMQVHDRTKAGVDTYQYDVQPAWYKFWKKKGGVGGDMYSDWTDSTSKGGYWWDHIRDVYSPANKLSTPPSNLATGFGEDIGLGTPAETREFKMKGSEKRGILGAGETRAPLGIDPKGLIAGTGQPHFEPLGGRDVPTGGVSIQEPLKFGEKEKTTKNPKQAGRKRSRGKSATRAPVDKGTTVSIKQPTKAVKGFQFNSAPITNNLSFGKFREFVKSAGVESIGKGTFYKIKATEDYIRKNHKFRYNSIAFGNVMNFDIWLTYDTPKGRINEKACPNHFEKINSHIGDLWLYEDRGHGGTKMNVGTYKYWWDEDNKMPMGELDYDEELILNNVPNDSLIAQRINAGLVPEMSTEYYCGSENRDGTDYQVHFHNEVGDAIFNGIAIVDKGNCGPPYCNFEVKED